MYECGTTIECLTDLGTRQFILNIVRYYPLAGLLYLIVWVYGKRKWISYKIQDRFPEPAKIWHEVKWSFVTLTVFTLIALTSISFSLAGWNKVYTDFSSRGFAYAALTFFLLVVFHETWFYWMHRLVHRKPWFKLVHLTHHKSTNPSPFAAYSFHWAEAFLEAVYIPIFLFLMPVHPYVILTQAAYAMVMNIWWHSGYEIFPSGWTKGRLTKWVNTSTHHNMHHSHFNGNFSLYFNFWDRICKTNFLNYDEYFESVVAKSQAYRKIRSAATKKVAA